jgi:hypothetical protein
MVTGAVKDMSKTADLDIEQRNLEIMEEPVPFQEGIRHIPYYYKLISVYRVTGEHSGEQMISEHADVSDFLQSLGSPAISVGIVHAMGEVIGKAVRVLRFIEEGESKKADKDLIEILEHAQIIRQYLE